MKAVILTQYGSPDYFELRHVDKPTPKDNEVLVKIHAASVNSWDWEILSGKPFVNRFMVGLFRPTKIPILGCDIAGTIETVGRHVVDFKPDDEVFGDISHSGWGGFAEYVCVRENALAFKPVSLTFEQAAAVPQAAVLALQGLRKGNIQKEKNDQVKKVLINGASGGVGSFAVPLAKLYGAEVTGVCSAQKMEFVRSLGAEHVIDYTQEDFTKNGIRYDLILDVKGFHSIKEYKRALTPDGSYVMIGGASTLVNQLFILGPWFSLFGGQNIGILLHKPKVKDLNYLKELLDERKIFPFIDRYFPLSDVAEAMRYYGAGYAKGKVIITM